VVNPPSSPSWTVGFLPVSRLHRRRFDANTFTDWAGDPSSTLQDRRAAFVPGWIKRVLEGINPFEARVREFGSSPTQTALYETVLRRGFALSVDGTPPQTNPAVNSALLLAATRISDFYMLFGNEAYADAQDPTIGFTSADGEVGSLAPSLYSFANQLPSLIGEELSLLRGRDNSSAGVGAAPVYNRLFWNFTGGLEGEPVYVQNYGRHRPECGRLQPGAARVPKPSTSASPERFSKTAIRT